MKKIILSILAVAAFGTANAQDGDATAKGFAKGDMFAEGSFSIRSGDVEDSWSFTPKVGYMINDKIALGGFLAFSGSENNANDKVGRFGLGAFARYYFLSLGADKAFQAYGELGLGYSSIKSEPAGGGSSTDSAMNANIDLGINYFFTSHWAATFELANILSYNNTNPENGDNSSDLNVEVNLFNNIFAQPQFGLLYKW
ncbi:MAG TPA: outer membrane beta-barrel protein [Flavobacterium sp.]|jgi:outer membrane protein W|nr:outer membrane beta-barrel protein [Flavobacterium sp.]HRZ31885.1 outer membrane beta-barrel protein [Flavobacterium sp.]HRZ74542.1 outer membrane beta-barrel protein [Flavobacterium sp.]